MAFIKGYAKDVINFNYNWILNELNKDNDIMGISRIGFTNDGYEIFIVTDDDLLSDVPHFHYRKKMKGKSNEFHTCIKFNSPEYYHHIGNEDILNKKQLDNLIIFLSSNPLNTKHFKSNWELLLFIWNTQNKNIKIDDKLKMPNYLNLY